MLLGELPGWLWNYFELLCQSIDEVCGSGDDDDEISQDQACQLNQLMYLSIQTPISKDGVLLDVFGNYYQEQREYQQTIREYVESRLQDKERMHTRNELVQLLLKIAPFATMLRAEETIGSNLDVDGEQLLIYAKVLELKLLQASK